MPQGSAPSESSNFKTVLCENYERGICTRGANCTFAHGAGELQAVSTTEKSAQTVCADWTDIVLDTRAPKEE